MRKISQASITLGVLGCFVGSIWSPEESTKWILSALYLILVGKYFGLTFRKEEVKGSIIIRDDKDLNFLNMKKIK